MKLMRAVLDLLFPPRATELLVRAVSPETLFTRMEPKTDGQGVTALLPYRDPIVHALVIEAKYNGNGHAASLLASVLEEYLLERLADDTALHKQNVALVPLPLSGKRKRARGYNQAEEICRRTAAALGEAVRLDTSVLRRVKDTLPQTRLRKEERLANVKDAFEAGGVDPAYLYMVVDDVHTTGATLGEAVKALRDAGAKDVAALALAY